LRIDFGKLGPFIGVLIVLTSIPAAGALPRFAELIESVLQKGPEAQLPPHLSLALGIGTGDAPLAVKQAVLRDGPEVRVFEVRMANHKDIVILRTNEQEQTTRAYLVSATGKLRKAVFYKAGAEPQQIPPAEAHAALANEIKFWTDFSRRPAAQGGAR
jgi:hypothetical protein